MSAPAVARSVMVVDDSGVFGFTLSLEFRKAGWDIFCCGSAEEALKKLQERNFDLVLTDLNMPGMKGDALATLILEKCPQTKVILMSSHPKDALPPLPRGVPFLPKPVNVAKILEAFDRSSGKVTGVIQATTGVIQPPPPPSKPK